MLAAIPVRERVHAQVDKIHESGPSTHCTEDIPQPSDTPYEPGTRYAYTASDDPDSHHYNTVCEVLTVFENDLGETTGRDLDAYTYGCAP